MAKKTIKKTSRIAKKINLDFPVKLTDTITSERQTPQYFNEQVLKIQPEILYRLDLGDHRYYYKMVDDEPKFFVSVTTMIKKTLPTSPHLIEWMVNKGKEEGQSYLEERADYGTFMHGEIGTLLMTGHYNLDTLKDRLKEYCIRKDISYQREWVDELKKDILAFAQFIIDTNLKPLAIEIVLSHPEDGYAGAIDLVAELDIEEKGFYGETYASGVNKGQPKESKRTRRVIAIIDMKSGRKGFYEAHEIQLQAYLEMWQIQFPDVRVERLFNWSPKDFRGTPTYNLKDQTGSKNLFKLPHLSAISKVEESKRTNRVTLFSGDIILTKGLSENIEELSYSDLIKRDRGNTQG